MVLALRSVAAGREEEEDWREKMLTSAAVNKSDADTAMSSFAMELEPDMLKSSSAGVSEQTG